MLFSHTFGSFSTPTGTRHICFTYIKYFSCYLSPWKHILWQRHSLFLGFVSTKSAKDIYLCRKKIHLCILQLILPANTTIFCHFQVDSQNFTFSLGSWITWNVIIRLHAQLWKHRYKQLCSVGKLLLVFPRTADWSTMENWPHQFPYFAIVSFDD